jgi:tyrosyl-tRNA synthetase
VPLVVKWGIDPLRPSLHLGHLSNLLKLREFLEFRHKVKVVLGTFTGIIGDPSGNLDRRPRIDQEQILSNARQMEAQIRTILGNDANLQVIHNDVFEQQMKVRTLWEWMYKIDVRHLLKRGDFNERLEVNKGLSMAELVYPLFQAHDSIQLKVDLELGGADQLWNCKIAAKVMEGAGLEPEYCLLMNLVQGYGRRRQNEFILWERDPSR